MKNPVNILITGGSSGIGAALAETFANPNVCLYLSGRDPMRLEVIAEKCRQLGAFVDVRCLDVTNQSQMQEWICAVDQKTPLDLVIANAGISGGTAGLSGRDIPFEAFSQVRKIFDVNLYGVLNTVEPILERMIQRHRGQIAIVSSLAGYRGWPTAPAYTASKGAVRFYGEALRGALRKTGVQVNVICPGFVTSRMTDVNQFKMPFKMPADHAAFIIKNGLRKNKGRIAFPVPVLFFCWLMAVLPDFLVQKILTLFPAKNVFKE